LLASDTEKEEVSAARGGMLVLLRSSLFRKDTSDPLVQGTGYGAQRQRLNVPVPIHSATLVYLSTVSTKMESYGSIQPGKLRCVIARLSCVHEL
jgi:hypothetical protein